MGKIKHGSKAWVITYGTVVSFVIGNRQSDFFLFTPPCPDLPMIFRIPTFDGISRFDAIILEEIITIYNSVLLMGDITILYRELVSTRDEVMHHEHII